MMLSHYFKAMQTGAWPIKVHENFDANVVPYPCDGYYVSTPGLGGVSSDAAPALFLFAGVVSVTQLVNCVWDPTATRMTVSHMATIYPL